MPANITSLLIMLSLFIRPNRVWNLFMVKAWTASNKYSRRLCQSRIFQQQVNEERYSTAAAPVPRKFVPFPFPYHHIIEARVDSLTNLGFGICRVPLPDDARVKETSDKSSYSSSGDGIIMDAESNPKKGWVVMVPNVIPGELIQCRIYRNHGTYSDADLVKVIEEHSKVSTIIHFIP